jgi:hypothetical protein
MTADAVKKTKKNCQPSDFDWISNKTNKNFQNSCKWDPNLSCKSYRWYGGCLLCFVKFERTNI